MIDDVIRKFHVDTMVKVNELIFLRDLLGQVPEDKRNGHVFNIGIFNGASVLALAEGMKKYNYSNNLVAIGICRRIDKIVFNILPMKERRKDYETYASCFDIAIKNIEQYSEIDTERIVIHYRFSDDICLGEKKISVIFMDGDHSTHGVLLDLLKYSQHIVPEGFIALHDYNTLFISKAIEIFLDIRPDFCKHKICEGISVLKRIK